MAQTNPSLIPEDINEILSDPEGEFGALTQHPTETQQESAESSVKVVAKIVNEER